MSDDNILEDPFQVDGRYNQDADRNGDRIPDRMQQGYDSGTGDPLKSDYPEPVRLGIDHVENGPDERGHREKLALFGATFDNARGNGRDPEARGAADGAIAGASAVEKSVDSKPKAKGPPNFHEREAAKKLWERRKDMPKKEKGVLANLRQIQSGSNDGKTGIEVLQSLGHGFGAGLMIGARQAERKAEIKIYKENEEFHLENARSKDRDTLQEANEAAREKLDSIIAGGSTPPGTEGGDPGTPPPGTPAPGGAKPEATTPGPETPTAGRDGAERGPDAPEAGPVPKGPEGDGPQGPGPAGTTVAAAMEPDRTKETPETGAVSGETPAIGREIHATSPSFEPQAKAPTERTPERTAATTAAEPQPSKQAGVAKPVVAKLQGTTPAPQKAVAPTYTGRTVDPATANGNLAAGAALATVAPMAAPVLTAGVTHRAQKEVGTEHAGPQRSTGTKGPAQAGRGVGVDPKVNVTFGRTAKPGERTLAPAPNDAPRKQSMMGDGQAGHRQGGLHQLATSLTPSLEPAGVKGLSKGPTEIGTRRPGAGIGMVTATRIIAQRSGADQSILENMRDKKTITR